GEVAREAIAAVGLDDVARAEGDLGVLLHLEDVLLDVRVDLLDVPRAERARIVTAVLARADYAEALRVEARLHGAGRVVDLDREALDADLEVVGHLREEPVLIGEDEDLGVGSIESSHARGF